MGYSRIIAGASVLAVSGLGVMATAAGASAAETTTAKPAAVAAAYNGACGSGYSVVNSRPVGTKGTLFLTYSAKTRENCVVTVRTTAGAPVHMGAWVSAVDGHGLPSSDIGVYRSYAGPAYISLPGFCVAWGGEIDGTFVQVDSSNCG